MYLYFLANKTKIDQSSAKMFIIRSTLCDLSYGLKDTSDKISGLWFFPVENTFRDARWDSNMISVGLNWSGLSQTLKNGRGKCNKCQKWNQRGHQRWAVSTLGRWREFQRQGEKGRNTNSSQDIPQRWLKEWLQPFWLDIWWWEFEILLNLKWQRYIFFFPGNTSIKLIKYPKTILGGKSNPKLKNLKPFIKVSYTTNTERL